VHYKSQQNAKAQRKHKQLTNIKSLTITVWFQQFSELDRISHGADVVGPSVPGGRTRTWERPLAELRAQASTPAASYWLHRVLDDDAAVIRRFHRAGVPGAGPAARGVVLKKKWGTPETRLRQRFLNNLGKYTYTHTRQKNSAVLKLSYTAFQ